MKRIILPIFCLALVLQSAEATASQSNNFDKPIPAAARQSFKRANKLADQEKFAEALAECKKAIATAPNFVQAYVKYINLKGYLMERLDEVKAEYESLAAKNPADAVYPAALAIGMFTEPQATKNKWLEGVVRLAPDSAWGHYAKGQLLQEKEPEAAVAEYYKAIERDATLAYPYSQLIFIQEVKLKNIDEAIATAEKMALQPDLKTTATSGLWRLRLKKAGSTDEAKAKLRVELARIAETANDVYALVDMRSAYQNLLKDKEAATSLEEKIKRVDPFWYAERGIISSIKTTSSKGTSTVIYAGHQLSIFRKLGEIDFDLEAEKQKIKLEELLLLNPNKELKRNIYTRLFFLTPKIDPEAVRYGEALLALDPEDSSTMTDLAITLVDQKRDLEKALGYARRAEQLTTKPCQLILNKSEAQQKTPAENHQMDNDRARCAGVLDAYGWVLFKMGKTAEAEAKVGEAMKFRRSENNLSHMSEILRALNRNEEADRFISELKNINVTNIKSQLKAEPAKDFELSTIDGRKVKLSDLKGKIVMVNFWATWCKPCVKEMPMFVKIYEKYKERGFEILAITVDAIEDRPKVVSFTKEQNINFPVLYDESVAALYGVNSFPTTFFIGKQGAVRYQNTGFSSQSAERDLEIIIEELMKDK